MCNIKKYIETFYLLHFIIPIILGEVLFTIAYEFEAKWFVYLLFALAVVAGIFSKEFIWDKWLKKGIFEWADIIIGCSALILVVVQWIFILT